MKQFFSFLVWMIFVSASLAQQIDTTTIKPDSALLLSGPSDTVINTIIADTADALKKDSAAFTFKSRLLNVDATPVAMVNQFRIRENIDPLFYILAGLLLLLGSLKYFYNRYFNNIVRVFANTSLKQSQLTDQMLQEKLASMFYNLFFVFAAGIYIYVMLRHFNWVGAQNRWNILGISILAVTTVYTIKYTTLKFTGWITGYREVTSSYVFIVFLFNKVLGIILVPLVVILIYANAVVAAFVAKASFFIIILLLLLRFFRSYSLLEYKLKISRFHFLLYIIAIEILPLLLIYKLLMIFLNKIM